MKCLIKWELTIEKDNQVKFIKEINYSENVLQSTLNVLLNNL